MIPEDLRKHAEEDRLWCEERIAVYREDGAKIPEALARLDALAGDVLTTRIGTPLMDTQLIQARKDAAGAREMARGYRVVLEDISKALERLGYGGPISQEMACTPGGHADDGDEHEPDPTPFDASDGELEAEAAILGIAARPSLAIADQSCVRWPASGLYHGLLLRNVDTGERRLIGEPIKGQYSAQSVAPDGLTAGEPWSTLPDGWKAAEWRDVTAQEPIAAKPRRPRYDAPVVPAPTAPASPRTESKAKPPAAERTLPMFEPPKAVEYVPTDAQFEKWHQAINEHLQKTGKPCKDVLDIRSAFDNWKTSTADQTKANPAAAFWLWLKASVG